MNFMKKLFNEKIDYVILILFIISSTITLLMFYIRNSQKLIFLTVQDNHSIICNKDNLLDLNIKCSRQDTMYMNKEMVDNTYILDYTTKDTYMIDLVDIVYINRYSYEHDSYFDYKLTFSIPFDSNKEIELNNFYLVINYLNDETLNFKMGSLSILPTTDDSFDILINNMKGIVNTFEEKQYLVGVIFDIENLLDCIEIINISTISSIVDLDLSNIVYLDSSDINPTEDIKDLLCFEYDPFIYNHNINNINIDLSNELILFIPLKYKQVIQVKTLGFIIEYLQNGEYHYQLIYPFKFFNTYSESIVEKIEYDFN